MATSSVDPQFIPTAAQLRALEVAMFSRAEQEAAELAERFAESEAGALIATARDEFSAAASAGDAPAAADVRAADAVVDALRTAVAGRDDQESLLSLHIAFGFAADAVSRLYAGQPDRDSDDDAVELFGAEHAAAAQAALVSALEVLFAGDTLLDDRLAMWGRRVAGDSAVWARTLLGLKASESRPEADETVQWLLGHCFAGHSRRMNVLKLAA